jgi:hypothetical protein
MSERQVDDLRYEFEIEAALVPHECLISRGAYLTVTKSQLTRALTFGYPSCATVEYYTQCMFAWATRWHCANKPSLVTASMCRVCLSHSSFSSDVPNCDT